MSFVYYMGVMTSSSTLVSFVRIHWSQKDNNISDLTISPLVLSELTNHFAIIPSINCSNAGLKLTLWTHDISCDMKLRWKLYIHPVMYVLDLVPYICVTKSSPRFLKDASMRRRFVYSSYSPMGRSGKYCQTKISSQIALKLLNKEPETCNHYRLCRSEMQTTDNVIKPSRLQSAIFERIM